MNLSKVYFRRHANHLSVVVWLLLWSTAAQLFLNIDSPLHNTYGHIDSAWFFMCGKAWMNGLVPYVDFADSKGPMLWLIYGLGYLISPLNFNGLYYLSCIYFTAILYICYRMALLFLDRSRIWAFLAASAMVVPYFCWIDVEVRAEHWCQLPLIYCLYRLTCGLVDTNTLGNRKAMLYMGIGVAAVALIKWNISLLYGLIPSVIIVLYAIGHRIVDTFKLIGAFVIGFTCTLLPFIIILCCYSSFYAFVQEYFLNTGQMMISLNIGGKGTLGAYFKNFLEFMISTKLWSVVFCLSSVLLLARHRCLGLIPAVIGLIFIAVLSFHDMGYYLLAMSSFAIYLTIWLAKGIRTSTIHVYNQRAIVIGSLCLIMLWSIFSILRSHGNIKGLSPVEQGRLTAETAAKTFNKPRILYYHGYECGFGIEANSLPTSKYWSLQNGASQQMGHHQDSILLSGKADIIVFQPSHYTFSTSEPSAVTERRIMDAGYIHISDFSIENIWTSKVYVRHNQH